MMMEDEESNYRYIVKYKKNSKEFQQRLQTAKYEADHMPPGISQLNTVQDEFLEVGRFIPKDDAEVVYIHSEEEMQAWNEKEEVEYVELGKFRYDTC